MICLKLNLFYYDPSCMLQLSELVWTLRSSTWVVFNDFLLIYATDRSKISIDQKRLFFAVSLYPLSFFANTPFILEIKKKRDQALISISTFLKFSALISLLARDRLAIEISEVRTAEWIIINLEYFEIFGLMQLIP